MYLSGGSTLNGFFGGGGGAAATVSLVPAAELDMSNKLINPKVVVIVSSQFLSMTNTLPKQCKDPVVNLPRVLLGLTGVELGQGVRTKIIVTSLIVSEVTRHEITTRQRKSKTEETYPYISSLIPS